jgi:hypothetical protein
VTCLLNARSVTEGTVLLDYYFGKFEVASGIQVTYDGRAIDDAAIAHEYKIGFGHERIGAWMKKTQSHENGTWTKNDAKTKVNHNRPHLLDTNNSPFQC